MSPAMAGGMTDRLWSVDGCNSSELFRIQLHQKLPCTSHVSVAFAKAYWMNACTPRGRVDGPILAFHKRGRYMLGAWLPVTSVVAQPMQWAGE